MNRICPICGEPVGPAFRYLSDYRNGEWSFSGRKRPVHVVCPRCFSRFETATRGTELFVQGTKAFLSYTMRVIRSYDFVDIEMTVVESKEGTVV